MKKVLLPRILMLYQTVLFFETSKINIFSVHIFEVLQDSSVGDIIFC